MRSYARTGLTGTARLLLFALSFVLLQFCAFQMSAQAFAPAQDGLHSGHGGTGVAAVKNHHSSAHRQLPDQTVPDQNHGKNSPACAVSGCTLPIPVAPLLHHIHALPETPATGLFSAIKGLPPLKTERPPISASI